VVARLRRKVEADPANPRHVITVRGFGYRLDRGEEERD
jgi:two-component system response regulator RegX3